MYWTDVIYVLDWCFYWCMHWTRCDVPTGLQCGTVVTVIQKPLIMGGCVSLVPESYMQCRGISY